MIQSNPTAPLYKLTNIYKSLGNTAILNDISLTVESGDFVSILGPSGSGKTTFLRLFNNLDSPTDGKILFSGKALSEWNIVNLRKQVGMVFQEPIVLAGNVQDNLLLATRWEKTLNIISEPDLYNTLEKVGLQKIELTTDARSLSGGEKQRLALARVLINQPQVLLLDEPTSSLDPALARRIMKRVSDLQEEMNITVIWVSHDPDLARRFARRVVFLEAGTVVEDGPVSILDAPDSPQLKSYLEDEH